MPRLEFNLVHGAQVSHLLVPPQCISFWLQNTCGQGD